MIIPLIIPILGWALLGGVGGTGVALAIGLFFDSMKGKSVAVLGERSSGKTTLAEFLSSGEIHEKYEQTLQESTLTGRTMKLGDLELEIQDINDVPGDKDFYNYWKTACLRSDFIFYLARADKVLSSSKTRDRIFNDIRHIKDWLVEHPEKRMVFIGTHCDLIPHFSSIKPDKLGDFQDAFFRNNEMRDVAILLREAQCSMILGSLRPERDLQILVHQVFRQIVKKSET